MRYEDVAIPAGLAWSSPFAKWQGPLARGGGIGLFTGCAAGDTGAAIVLRVED
jgi:hypothetical protein